MSDLKTIVRGAYDLQKLRIQMGNRIVGNFKAKLGQEPGKKEDELDAAGKLILANLRRSYKKLTDGVKTFPRYATFTGDEVISTYTELCLLSQYTQLEASEKTQFTRLKSILMEYPVFVKFLNDVKGIGPAMGGVIISEFDIHKAQYPSSMWKYAGLDVAHDGQGRSRRKEHQIDEEYVDKDGEIQTKKSITFNPFLKTKLIGVLGSSFLRAGKNTYSKIYADYKNRLANHPAHKEKSKGHRHNMAIRYMIKRFLVDLYTAWRTIEGLPVALEYSEAKLNIKHRAAWNHCIWETQYRLVNRSRAETHCGGVNHPLLETQHWKVNQYLEETQCILVNQRLLEAQSDRVNPKCIETQLR